MTHCFISGCVVTFRALLFLSDVMIRQSSVVPPPSTGQHRYRHSETRHTQKGTLSHVTVDIMLFLVQIWPDIYHPAHKTASHAR